MPVRRHTRTCRIESLEARTLLTLTTPVISELMAVNDGTLQDGFAQFSDWIEVHNPTATSLDLGGWFLTDNPSNLDKWQFPTATTLDPGEHLLLFASGQDEAFSGDASIVDPQGFVHTSFELAGDGEFLALVGPDGATVVHGFASEYPPQVADVSYGIDISGDQTTLVESGAELSYLIPTLADASLGTTWTAVEFEDALWNDTAPGPLPVATPIGFGTSAGGGSGSPLPGTISYIGGEYSEDFDSARSSAPAGWTAGRYSDTQNRQPPGSTPINESLQADNGSSSTKSQSYNYGTTRDPDRAIGHLPTTSTGDRALQAAFTNNTGGAITQFMLSYAGEQWRNWQGGASPEERLVVYFSNEAGSNFTSLGSQFEFIAPQNENLGNEGGAALDGNAPTNRRVITGTFILPEPVADGEAFFITFHDQNDPTSDHALAVDDFEFTATFDLPLGADIETEMKGVNSSAWVRIPFEVTDTSNISQLLLSMTYDDGFVAYLNGVEVVSVNAPVSPPWNATANPPERTGAEIFTPDVFDLSSNISDLVLGENVLALHGLNITADNADFVLSPELTLIQNGPTSIPAARFFGNATPGEANDASLLGPAGVVAIDTPGQTFVQGDALNVQLAVDSPTAEIRYTLDGTTPNGSSLLYENSSIVISSTTQLRARAVEAGFLPGPVAGEGYIGVDAVGSNRVDTFQSYLPIYVVENFGGPTVDFGSFRDFHLTVIEPDPVTGVASMTDAPLISTRMGIHTRGASSSGFPKKQYRIETRDQTGGDQDFDLLGTGGAEADWVLNGMWVDKSLIRAPFGFGLGSDLGVMGPETRMVEVYLHQDGGLLSEDDYIGTYVLMENIKIGQERIDIPEPTLFDVGEPEITGGYSLKFQLGDDNARLEGWDDLQLIDSDRYTAGQLQWISDYVNDFDAAIPGGDDAGFVDFMDFIDLDSWMANLLIHELNRDQDAYVHSAYFFKDRGGLLTQGMLWDFDLTLGVGGFHSNQDLAGWQFDINAPGSFPFNVGERDWNGRLFMDADFSQAFIDAYHDARQGLMSLSAMYDRVDYWADFLRDPDVFDGVDAAAVHNFQRWPDLLGDPNPGFDSPATATWEQQIDFIKDDWLVPRIAWMDDQFVELPVLSHPGGQLDQPLNVTFTLPSSGVIYYTLDGSDPRAPGGGINAAAAAYSGESINIDSTTEIRARTYDPSVSPTGTALVHTKWSAPTAAVYSVASLAVTGDLAITEINYNPHPLNADEAADGVADKEALEFLEVTNISGHPVNLAGASFTAGVDFTFGNSTLNDGDSVVVVKDQAAFAVRYGTASITIAGAFERGSLASGGERLALSSSTGATMLEFSYDDEDGWPERADGHGSTLVIIDPAGDHGDENNWLPSSLIGGTPGDTGSSPAHDVIVNEILSHTEEGQPELIEVVNITPQPVDISGWFLTDDVDDFTRFELPNTVMQPGEYAVISQTTFGSAFAFDGDFGDQLYLIEANATGRPIRFADEAIFRGSFQNVSLGRVPDADPTAQGARFFPMLNQTFGAPNSMPVPSDVVISELHYHPVDPGPGPIGEDELEFVELFNPTAAAVDLGGWRIDGIGYTFAAGVTIPARSAILLVQFDPVDDPAKTAAFRTFYGVAGDVMFIGGYPGRLDNGGENIELLRPEEPASLISGMVVVDAVSYLDHSPWPTDSDGGSKSLSRAAADAFGNFAVSWSAESPTPGVVDFVLSGTSADFNVDGVVDGADFLRWQTGFGTPHPDATKQDGDADDDKDVDAADLAAWEASFGDTVELMQSSLASNTAASALTAMSTLSPSRAELADAALAYSMQRASVDEAEHALLANAADESIPIRDLAIDQFTMAGAKIVDAPAVSLATVQDVDKETSSIDDQLVDASFDADL